MANRPIIINGKFNIGINAILAELSKHYPQVTLSARSSDERLVLDTNISDEEFQRLQIDLNFFLDNQDLALENVCNNLGNYRPENESQQEVLKFIERLLGLDATHHSAGLFLYGPPGIGKTHLCVAVAKEVYRRTGVRLHYLRAEKLDDYITYKNKGCLELPNQTWIIDDLNSPYGTSVEMFRKVVLSVHDKGGKIFATSNMNYSEFMDKMYFSNEADRLRYNDRIRGMFKDLKVEGKSRREREAWYK